MLNFRLFLTHFLCYHFWHLRILHLSPIRDEMHVTNCSIYIIDLLALFFLGICFFIVLFFLNLYIFCDIVFLTLGEHQCFSVLCCFCCSLEVCIACSKVIIVSCICFYISAIPPYTCIL